MAIDSVTIDTHNLYNPHLWYKKQYATESIFIARLLTVEYKVSLLQSNQ